MEKKTESLLELMLNRVYKVNYIFFRTQKNTAYLTMLAFKDPVTSVIKSITLAWILTPVRGTGIYSGLSYGLEIGSEYSRPVRLISDIWKQQFYIKPGKPGKPGKP